LVDDYSIEFLRTVQKELAKLSLEIQQRIATKIEDLKKNPYFPQAKALKNSDGRMRFRVGDYRVIYRLENQLRNIVIVKVGHRRNTCKN